jgi:hypothetical protein
MGRLIPLRRRRSPLYAVKETVAALNEELEFTLNYAQALTRDQSYHAAAEVIEEQRRSLALATERMEQAVMAPAAAQTRSRVRVALAGIAAAVAIASSAFASFGTAAHKPAPQNPRIEAIHQATAALASTTTISDPATLQAIVFDAQQTILEAARAVPSDPNLKQSLLDSVEKLRAVARNPNVPARVRQQAKKAAEAVKKIVVEVPDSSASSSSSSAEPSSTETPAAPATPPPA